MKSTLQVAYSGVVGVALMASASVQAIPMITSSVVGGVPTGVNYVTFDNLANGTTGSGVVGTGPNGSVSLDFLGNSRVAQGNASGVFAAPFLSGGQGASFGGQPDGVDTTPYLSTGRSSIKISFGTDQQYLGLLWGSVDTYNFLDFYSSSDVLLGTISGSQVTPAATGNQGAQGTYYVNINSDPFRYVVARSSSFAFEFDNLAYSSRPVGVSDGGMSAGFLGLGLMGLAAWRRRAMSV
jgi:hypothetical protein